MSFTGGAVNMGTRVFSLSVDLASNMQVSSHGLNVLDTSSFNITVGNAPPNGTPFVRRFAVCFRSDINLHPSGSCATGWPANFFTDNNQQSLFCNPAITPAQTSILEYTDGCNGAYQGWRDVTTATVSGLPLWRFAYQGIWAIRCCTRDAFPASYTTFGSGCAGTLPTSTLQPLALPRVGTTFGVIVDNLPENLCFWVLGLSNQNSTFGPLPFNAAALGAPGCLLHISPDSPQLLFANNNVVLTQTTLPNNQSLVGATFFQQALVLDASANAFGAVVSNAAAASIGL